MPKIPSKTAVLSHATDNPLLSAGQLAIVAANHLIETLQPQKSLNESQHSLLASAHHTLAKQQEISLTRAKMHVNSAITLFQKIKRRNLNLDSELAKAYFNRAEMREVEYNYISASMDYQKVLAVIEENNTDNLSTETLLLLAQSAISIADILVNERVAPKQLSQTQPLYYINKALEYLSKLQQDDDSSWTTLAYAHQVAGLALSETDITAATDAFRTALLMAYKADPKFACPILGDIYNSLGLLHSHYFENTPVVKKGDNLQDHANIYFGMALFFNAQEPSDSEEADNFLDSLFDIVYRSLDPYLPALPLELMTDFIDALVFGFYCISHSSLPNSVICHKLQQPDLSRTYAQHIYWLVLDSFRREHNHGRMLELCDPSKVDIRIEVQDLLGSLWNAKPNISYFPKKLAAVT